MGNQLDIFPSTKLTQNILIAYKFEAIKVNQQIRNSNSAANVSFSDCKIQNTAASTNLFHASKDQATT